MKTCLNCAERPNPIMFDTEHPCLACHGERVVLNGTRWRPGPEGDDALPKSGRAEHRRALLRLVQRDAVDQLLVTGCSRNLRITCGNILFSVLYRIGRDDDSTADNRREAERELVRAILTWKGLGL